MGKTIKVPKKVFGQNKNIKDPVAPIEKKIMKVTSKFNQYGFIDPTEEEFLDKYRGKKILVELKNGQNKEGILVNIDKYRLSIKLDDTTHNYYKHAIICYSSDDEPNLIEEEEEEEEDVEENKEEEE